MTSFAVEKVSPPQELITLAKSKPFEGLTSGILGEEVRADGHLSIAIVGPPKSGKSWLASTAPQPILYYDFDNRKESLRGKSGLNIITLYDSSQANPTVISTIEGDLSTIKYRVEKGEEIPKTVVFDSMTHFKKCIENSLMKQMGKGTFREISIAPGHVMRQPVGWDVINGVEQYLYYFIAEWRSLMNIIIVFHEKDEKDNVNSTEKVKAYTGMKVVDPQYLNKCLTVFNEVWRIDYNVGSSKYEVQITADGNFRASTVLELEGIQEPNIQQMLEKHKQALSK
jgi:AAA domain